MPFPKFPDKHAHTSVFSASDIVRQNPRFVGFEYPERIILCFQRQPFDHLVKKYRGEKLPLSFGELFVLKGLKSRVGVAGKFGIGAPAAVSVLEWLSALGAKQYIVAGFAGGLLETQHPGDMVVCSKALRDEGTSYHYLPPAEFSEPDGELTRNIRSVLANNGVAHDLGPTWTIDAPFRETLPEIEHHRRNGILTVDMEAAALFAAAKYLGVACAAIFAIGDTPKNGQWQIDFDRRALKQALIRCADTAVQTLRTD